MGTAHRVTQPGAAWELLLSEVRPLRGHDCVSRGPGSQCQLPGVRGLSQAASGARRGRGVGPLSGAWGSGVGPAPSSGGAGLRALWACCCHPALQSCSRSRELCVSGRMGRLCSRQTVHGLSSRSQPGPLPLVWATRGQGPGCLLPGVGGYPEQQEPGEQCQATLRGAAAGGETLKLECAAAETPGRRWRSGRARWQCRSAEGLRGWPDSEHRPEQQRRPQLPVLGRNTKI